MPHTSRASRLATCDLRCTTTAARARPGCERTSSASACAIVSSTSAISRWKMRERSRGGASQRASPETWQKMWREWPQDEAGREEEEEEELLLLLLLSLPSALSTSTSSSFPSSCSWRHSASTSSRIILTYHPSSCAELYSEPIDRARAPVTSLWVRV